MNINIKCVMLNKAFDSEGKARAMMNGINFKPNYMIAESYVDECYRHALEGFDEVTIMQEPKMKDFQMLLIATDDDRIIAERLQVNISMGFLESVAKSDRQDSLKEAIRLTLNELFYGMQNLYTVTIRQKMLDNTESEIRSHLRYLVDRYGIERFAKAVKLFEGEHL